MRPTSHWYQSQIKTSKKKLQITIPCDYRCKCPQWNISKSNNILKGLHTIGRCDCFLRNASTVHITVSKHISRMKRETAWWSHLIQKNHLTKSRTLSWLKKDTQQTRIRRKLLQPNKVHLWKKLTVSYSTMKD